MRIIISNSSSTPIYEQIKNAIINQIMDGELKEDEALPSIRALAQDIKISVMTIKKAYDELESEGYSDSEISYAIKNCGADWNEQAAIAAQSYLDLMSFSRQELIDQLLYEGFTEEQAEYGVTAVGY